MPVQLIMPSVLTPLAVQLYESREAGEDLEKQSG